MNKKEDHATKADIAGLETRLGAKIDAMGAKLDAKIGAVDARLDAKIDRVAVALVRTQADVHEIKATMSTKDQMERLLRSFDDFAARAVHYDRADASRGRALVEFELKLGDHDRRISALESSRLPPQAP